MGNNIFGQSQKTRAKEQAALERKVSGKEEKQQERTVLSLSITKEDRLKLKRYALDHEMTVAAVVHQWIADNIG